MADTNTPPKAPGAPSDRPQKSEAEQRAFFDAVMARAQDAQDAQGRRTRAVEVADVRIDLVFAGPRLEDEFMGALAHLEVDGSTPPAATFHIWDSASTGVEMVPPPCDRSDFTDRGDIWGFGSETIRSAFHWSEYSVCLLDVPQGVGVYWVADAADLPYWAKSSPMRSLFHWVLEARGMQLVHAAAIGVGGDGVLITGKGGVGKSSTALAGLASDMAYIGDDYLVVSLDPQPTAWTLYATAKLEPHQAQRFPELAPLIDAPGPGPGEKAVIYLFPAHKQRIVKSLTLKYVLTPRFGDKAQTCFEPISKVALHQAAAFTTMSQLPHAGLATHRFIGRLLDQTTGLRIVLGHDVRAVPKAIADLLVSDAPQPAASSVTAAAPLVSVVVPVFNGARFVRQAVDSILAQNYASIEIIIVDDGSTDDLASAIAALPIDVRVLHQPNQGPAAARNRGVRNASGDYIAFLDVDDLWPAGHLETMTARLAEAPDVDVALGLGQLARINPEEPEGYSLVGNPKESFPHYIGAALYRRRAFELNGFFDEAMRFGEDTDWFTRAREIGLNVERQDHVSLIVRRHDGNMTRGRSMVELNALRVFKNALDRRRNLHEAR